LADIYAKSAAKMPPRPARRGAAEKEFPPGKSNKGKIEDQGRNAA
jgi:hypothetical protein